MSESNISGSSQTRCWKIHQQIPSTLLAGKLTAMQVVAAVLQTGDAAEGEEFSSSVLHSSLDLKFLLQRY